MRRFLRLTHLWILAIPIALNILGAGLNQAVLIANHDRFPVMVNPRSAVTHGGADADGMMDDVHEVMSASTHLNWLADIFDLHDAIYSPGDLLLMLGDFTWSYAPTIWLVLILMEVCRRGSRRTDY